MANRHLHAIFPRVARVAAALGAATVTLGHAGGAEALEAKYDSLNRLVESTSGPVTETYKYDGWGNLVETCRSVSGGPATCTEHIVDEVARYPRIVADIPVGGGDARYYAYDATGLAAVKTGTGGVEVTAKDHAGSVRALVDGDGEVTDRRAYDAFGARRAPVAAGAVPYGYTGERETDNGLVYLRARHYAPEMGRFLQRDTFAGVLERPTSLNRYAYAENDPLNRVDPSGHAPVLLVWAAVALSTAGLALPWVMMGGQGAVCQSFEDPSVCQDPELSADMAKDLGHAIELGAALEAIGGSMAVSPARMTPTGRPPQPELVRTPDRRRGASARAMRSGLWAQDGKALTDDGILRLLQKEKLPPQLMITRPWITKSLNRVRPDVMRKLLQGVNSLAPDDMTQFKSQGISLGEARMFTKLTGREIGLFWNPVHQSWHVSIGTAGACAAPLIPGMKNTPMVPVFHTHPKVHSWGDTIASPADGAALRSAGSPLSHVVPPEGDWITIYGPTDP